MKNLFLASIVSFTVVFMAEDVKAQTSLTCAAGETATCSCSSNPSPSPSPYPVPPGHTKKVR